MSGVVKTVTTMLLLVFQYDQWIPGSENSIDSSVLVGLVLARKGSKSIPGKNTARLHGHPLIHWVLEAMMESGEFASIWVSTDDPILKDYVTKNKPAIKIHDRAWYTATDVATSLVAVQEFLSFHPEVSTVGLVQATSPFLHSSYIREAVALMKKHTLDSIFSVSRQRKLRWSTVTEAEVKSGQFTTPLNFDPGNRPRRQDWNGELVENGMFYFVRREIVMEGLLQGKRTYYVEIPEKHSLEIDTMDDLNLANVLMQSKPKSESSNAEL